MSTLLLRLAGPMQSWGTQDRFGTRFTEREPSKSGVIGLVCAALGRPRHESVADLAALRMGVRVDFEGVLKHDYHTAGGGPDRLGRYGVVKATGKAGDTVVSTRYYLADADFLVGLEGDSAILEQIETACRSPVWTLSLGRKAFVPGVPIHLPGPGGLRRDVSLETALKQEPWPRPDLAPREPEGQSLRCCIESQQGDVTRMDQPIGAAFQERTFGPRQVLTVMLALGKDVPLRRSADVSLPVGS